MVFKHLLLLITEASLNIPIPSFINSVFQGLNVLICSISFQKNTPSSLYFLTMSLAVESLTPNLLEIMEMGVSFFKTSSTS